MSVINQELTWKLAGERLATTTSERHQRNLRTVIEHMKAEAAADLEGLMSTLAADPRYHQWQNGHDIGPKGRANVRQFYIDFMATRTNILEYAVERIVVDDFCVVTEGPYRAIYPGTFAAAVGLPVDDESADYLMEVRLVVFWPLDSDGRLTGEDSYSSGPGKVTKLSSDALPQAYVDMVRGG
jgi:SnoaL-like domain